MARTSCELPPARILPFCGDFCAFRYRSPNIWRTFTMTNISFSETFLEDCPVKIQLSVTINRSLYNSTWFGFNTSYYGGFQSSPTKKNKGVFFFPLSLQVQHATEDGLSTYIVGFLGSSLVGFKSLQPVTSQQHSATGTHKKSTNYRPFPSCWIFWRVSKLGKWVVSKWFMSYFLAFSCLLGGKYWGVDIYQAER